MGSLAVSTDLGDQDADPVLRVVVFTWNSVTLDVHNCLNIADVDVNETVVSSFYCPGDQFIFVLGVFVDDVGIFRFPQALHYDLLSRSCRSPTEVLWGNFELDRVADFVCPVDGQGIL